jgi:flagellar biosynthetic protein FlhB
MADPQDDFNRTEDPTQKRRDEARRRGDAPRSAEVATAVMLVAAALALSLFGASAARTVGGAGVPFLEHPHLLATDAESLRRLFVGVSGKLALGLSAVLALLIVAGLAANIGQTPPVFKMSRLAPDLGRISPLAGLKRIYGPTGVFNFLKGLFKILIVGGMLLYALWPDRQFLIGLVGAGQRELLEFAHAETAKLLTLTAAAVSVLAAVDYAHQRSQWLKRLRMTREEVRRELRESEGDPLVKSRLKRERETRGRRRMLAAVKEATVVLMNPTHVAVALKYETGSDKAPVCVAKGAEELALRMREVANDNRVPVVENPPLARALFLVADIDREIPVEHYEAVAKVIGFILQKAEAARLQPR